MQDRDAGKLDDVIRDVLRDVLAIDAAAVACFTDQTPLFGALPELDSMAVTGLLTELEDRLGIVIDDDDVTGDLLSTFGALTDFAARKVSG
ncbi:MAG: acyl carrier protein [Sphingomonadaceae bacterium]